LNLTYNLGYNLNIYFVWDELKNSKTDNFFAFSKVNTYLEVQIDAIDNEVETDLGFKFLTKNCFTGYIINPTAAVLTTVISPMMIPLIRRFAYC